MHELSTATLHFDPPYPGLVGGAILHGWLVPKPGQHYTDVRVVAAGRTFPGVYGFPRADLAAFFKADQPHLLAGFSVTFNLPAGRHQLRFEACSITGEWQTLDTVDREVTPAEALPDPNPYANAPLDAPAFAELLRNLLRRAPHDGGADLPAAATTLITATPARHHLQHPPRPFHGHLDQPQICARAVFGRLAITGWVFHESEVIKNIYATTDLQAVQRLPYGRETPFLASRPGAPAHAVSAGYDGFIDLPTQLPLPATVRVYAELADGSWHLGSVARFHATDHEFAKRPFVPFSALTFWRAWRALVRATKARGWIVPSGPAYRRALREIWHDYRSRAPRRVTVPQRARSRGNSPGALRHAHLVTHNLNREGAPLFLLEFARHLRSAHHVELTVTSAREGPLRAEFAALGADVHVVDENPLYRATDARTLQAALGELAAAIDLRAADLVVANTLSAWWGVHLAHRSERPSLFYIHESTPPRTFFQTIFPADALSVVEASFQSADQVSFLTTATERYYAGLTTPGNRTINPGWIDLARIDAFRAGVPRAAVRDQLGVGSGRKLVINVGSVCERKGQHVFARAIDLLWRQHPEVAAAADFVMVGGRHSAYDERLADFLQVINRPNLRIVAETGDVYPYYAAADVFVCSSFEESFPRVLLEAMAFALPIVSTDVHGIPEIVRAGHDATLVPPGDTAALAAALRQVLADPGAAAARATAARKRVSTEFASDKLLPRHAAMAVAVTAGACRRETTVT